ncbi:MAG: nucleotidyltransferase family protein [Candidatus Micrarchaeales archaeon]
MGKIDPKIIELLKGFKNVVHGKYGVIKLVLFGSTVTGKTTKDSDIDLIVVVRKYDKHLFEKLMEEWHEEQGIHYPVDFLQYSEGRFNEMSRGINIVSQALKEGIVI